MSKELTPLEAFRIIKYSASEYDLFKHCTLYDIIETTLKEKEKQDKILEFLGEHIVFEDGVVKANFQWEVDDKETEEAIKEWLK